MKGMDFGVPGTRRRLLTGSLAMAGSAAGARRSYSPRIVCNTYLWNQLFSTPVRYIASRPDPLKSPPAVRQPGQRAGQTSQGGTVWTDEQWHSALSDIQYAGYRRLEVISATVLGKPVEDLLALLGKYGFVINHVWHSGPLYPAQTGEKTIARTVELLDRCRPLKSPDFFFDPFADRGPLSDEDARTQNRGLDRIGREVADRGMKLSVHNHEGPMRYGAKEWRGVVSGTDPALVWMCLDLDWCWQAGTDPFPLLYETGDKGRLSAIHMRTQHGKITDQTMEDGGDVDFRKAADYLRKIDFDGVLVEETEYMKKTRVTRTARENKRIARIWCEKVFGVSAQA